MKASDIVDILNGLLAQDHLAINQLFSTCVPCNDTLVNHPLAIVREQGSSYVLRVIGLINCLLGSQRDRVAIEYDCEEGGILRFVLIKGEQ